MQANDREGFEVELAKLCAGFDVPRTKARDEAFWTGLARMSLAQFRRCVERALGEESDLDKFPTVGGVWKLHKGQEAIAAKAEAPEDPDHLEYYANRLLWLHVSHRGGLGSVNGQPSAELAACQRLKRQLVTEFADYIRQGDELATPAQFVSFWLGDLMEISEVLPRTRTNFEQLIVAPGSSVPFPQSMARDLRAVPELAA